MVRYDKFFGGIAQDDRMQAVGQYTYGQNIDIRKGKWIELSQKPEFVRGTPLYNNLGSITCIQPDDSTWYVGTTEGTIQDVLPDLSVGGLLFDTLSTNDIIDMKAMGGDLYFFSNNNGWVRTNYTDGSPWVLGGNVTLITSLASTYRQSITVGDDLIFFIDGKKIGKVTSATPTSVSYFGSAFSVAFQAADKLVGLSMHGNTLWAYEQSGKMYALDNQSEEVIGFKDFKETIVAVRNMGSYDIVITSSVNNQFYRSWIMNTGVGPESHKLIRKYRFSNTVKEASPSQLWGQRFSFDQVSNCSDFCFADSEDILYWFGQDQGQSCIYTYGKTDNTLPDSVSIVSNANYLGVTWSTVKCMWTKDGYLYISYYTTENFVDKIRLYDTGVKTFPDEGYIITKVDDFGQYEIPKTIKQVMVGADIPAGTSIKLEYSINEGEFVEYRTFTNTDAIGTNGKKFEFSEPIEMFNEIAWKITLITTDSSITPKLYSFSHLLESELYEPSQ